MAPLTLRSLFCLPQLTGTHFPFPSFNDRQRLPLKIHPQLGTKQTFQLKITKIGLFGQNGAVEIRSSLYAAKTPKHQKETNDSQNRSKVHFCLLSRIHKEGWTIHEPYKDLDELTVSEDMSRNETILILSKPELELSKKHYFPISAFSLKK